MRRARTDLEALYVITSCILVVPLFASTSLASDGDLNQDGVIDGTDQAILLASWGPCSAPCAADLNLDGVVDGADLSIWMSPPSPQSPADSGEADETTEIDSGGLFADEGSDPAASSSPPAGESDSSGSPGNDPLDSIAIQSVPLPAPAWLTLAGLAGAWLVRRRLTA